MPIHWLELLRDTFKKLQKLAGYLGVENTDLTKGCPLAEEVIDDVVCLCNLKSKRTGLSRQSPQGNFFCNDSGSLIKRLGGKTPLRQAALCADMIANYFEKQAEKGNWRLSFVNVDHSNVLYR